LIPNASARKKVPIKGSVTGPAGEAIPGALVFFQRTRQEKDIVCSNKACKKGANTEYQFEDHEGRKLLFTYTNADGLYSTLVPLGKGFGVRPWYHISVIAPGYYPQCQGADVPESKQKVQTITNTLRSVKSASPGPRGTGKILLTVLDETGAVVPNLAVLIHLNSLATSPSKGGKKLNGIDFVQTSESGVLQTELSSGNYDVVIPSLGVCDEIVVSNSSSTELKYKVRLFGGGSPMSLR
jgi:hypothetical protein